MMERDVLEIYRSRRALFRHNGNPALPHPEFTSGLCSDTFVNSQIIFSYPKLAEELSEEIVRRLWMPEHKKRLPVNWVIGSSYGAIIISAEVARRLNARHGFVKKLVRSPTGFMCDFVIPRGSRVLICEDIVSTGHTTSAVFDTVMRDNPHPLCWDPGFVAVLDYGYHTLPRDVLTLATIKADICEPDRCPRCLMGSPRLRPRGNWPKFMPE